ncbi:MAG: chemotaxis protein CheW, partial [Candidatus Sericytochromatia bacterium]
MLDDISGHDILKSIRETEKQREIEKKSKIFIVSSSEDTKNILDSYKEEAELYIKKPITKEKLVNSLFKFGLINEVQANKQIVEFPDKEEFINLLDEIRLILVDMSESLFNLNERDFNEQKFEIKKNISIVRNLMSHLKLDLIVEIIDLTYNVLHKYDKLIKYNEFFLLFITDFILFLLNSLDLVKNKFSDSFLTDEKEHFYNKVLNPYFSFFETKDNNNESIELKDSLDNNLDKININSSESDTKNIKIISNIKESDLNLNISLPETKLDLKTSINKDIVSHSIKQNIKVDTDKVDQLFDLVGELITIGSTFTSYEQLKNFDDSLIRKNSKELNKIIKEIQEITISIRMIPLDELFNKMKRLVRDLSNKTNKPINFNIFGQDTEVDKNIIEELANPITHILRNAIDHGIEDENSRIQLNKPVEGNINLIAKYEGNHIAIIIEDDGKGLCIEGIYQKALEKGLVNPDKELTEQEIFKFIFEAGFSTAKEISDISGRGVGMDVVKKNIEKLNGKIFIDSIKDKGTKISLKIPLTLAILDAMLVEINNTFFAIPLEMINQSFKASSLHITDTPDGNSFVSIRSNLYKIIDLKQYFYKKISDKNKYDNSIFIIIESSEKNRVCFLVDKIIGQQQVVIKGIDETMGNLEGITGGMILGNGEIGFIIDVEKILSL